MGNPSLASCLPLHSFFSSHHKRVLLLLLSCALFGSLDVCYHCFLCLLCVHLFYFTLCLVAFFSVEKKHDQHWCGGYEQSCSCIMSPVSVDPYVFMCIVGTWNVLIPFLLMNVLFGPHLSESSTSRGGRELGKISQGSSFTAGSQAGRQI